MQNIKLIKMLKTFSDSEFSEFEKFVNSPFFSTGRNLSDFFNCLKPYFPGFTHRNFNEEYIFKKLYPGKKFDPKTSVNLIHKFSSELNRLGKEYLIQTELKNDRGRRYFYLLNNLRKKKLYPEFEKEYQNSDSSEDVLFRGSTNDLIDKYFLTQSYLEYCIDKGDIPGVFDSILLTADYLSAAALIKGFRNADTNKSSEAFNVKVRYNLTDNLVRHLNSDELLDEMKKSNDRFYPYLSVSYAINKMVTNPGEKKYFFELKDLINENLQLFGNAELYILFSTLINHCIINNDGDDREMYIKEEFKIYRKIFELGVYKYSSNDKIQINSFRSIILCAVDNGEIEWLEDFVKEHLHEMHSEYQESMKYYSMAVINFEKGEYEKSLENIGKVKYDFFLYKMDVKIIMFKIYFELEMFDQAYSIIYTMKQYISNSKNLSPAKKESGHNFIKYASILLKAKTSNEQIDINYFKEMLSAEKNIESEKWFLKKLELLS